MLSKTQKIAISKNFIISMLFISLIFAAFGLSLEVNYASDLNEDGNGLGMKLNIQDKLENSQTDELLEVDTDNGNILTANYVVEGRTFQDIQNMIDGASVGDKIILVGDYHSNGRESTVNITKRLTITSTSTATLDGKGISGILAVDNRAAGSVISNLKFINAHKEQGSALFINAKDVVVDNCCFENNRAYHGGVLQSRYNLNIAENVTVKNCNFTNNFGYWDGFENSSNAGAVGLYGINSKLINCIFDSNWVKSMDAVYGGAVQVGLDDPNYKALVYKCTFINNRAIGPEGKSHGGAGCVRNGVEYDSCVFINNSAGQGGALTFHASGKLRNCIFINNTATDLYGGAVSTGFLYDTMELEINNCYFEGNDAPKGGAIQALGLNIDIINSNFTKNHADTDGGALNIEALNVKVSNSNFDSNVAEVDGGAIYTKGSKTVVSESQFIRNEARPDYDKLDDGLGGAIYINSTQANVENSRFYYNTARNGSAIYYDKQGNRMTLRGNVLFENQAWVYHLPVYAHDIFYGETEHLKSVIHGGNNIAKYNNLAVSNAIYNAADYSKLSIDGEFPLDGATNNGKLYQDDREYNMEIRLTVKNDKGTVVYDRVLNSNYLGDVSDDLNGLQPGRYYVTAKHAEDTYYKAITNTTVFNVIPKVDNQIRKSAASDSYNYDDVVVWTLNITNNGPNKATYVNVTDVLPKGMIYIDDDSGKYNPVTGLLNIGELGVGKSVIVNIYARVNKTGDIVNNANVTAKEFDVDLSNNHDQAKITVPPTVDLEVRKYVNNSNPKYHDSIKWTIVVRNNGPDAAHNVKVTDILPKSLIDVTSDGNYNARTGIWDIGTLGINREVRLNIFCKVNATGTIKNDVSVKGKEVDRNMSNNYDSESVKVNKSTDLAIDKSIGVSRANYTDEITWKLVIVNNGPDNATGVKVTDVLPDGLIYVDSVLPRGTYSKGVITVGKLAVGEKLTYKLICRVNETGTIVNVASIKGNEYDYDMSNNRDDASILIDPATDLEVIKTVNVSNPRYHDYVTWAITVKNNGPDVAHDVVMSDLLPKSLVWKSDTGNGKYNHVTGKWTIGQLDSKGSVRLNIVAWVNATGTIRNDASVKGREFDYNPSNNMDSETIKVNKATDLAVDKSIDVSRANYTDEITWKLVIVNYGPDNATGVKVTDVLPDGLIYVDSVLPRGTYSKGVISVGKLAVGEKLTYNIISRLNKTGTIVNVASIKGNEYDYDMSNNRDDASILIDPAADLEVIKTVNVSNPNYNDYITWNIIVRNNGPDVAHDVVVSDLLPESVVWKSDTGNGKYNHITGKWTIGQLDSNGSVRLKIVTRVNATGFTQNNASVKGREFDYNPSNNNDSASIDVPKTADVSVVKIVNNSNPNYWDTIKWTVIAKNNGPDKATSVSVEDILPDGLVLKRVNASKGVYDNGIWNVCCLEKGEEQTLEIICLVNKTGKITNIASITAEEVDLNKSNNKDNESIEVPLTVDLEVVKEVSNNSPFFGETVTWLISIKNNGPDTATNVALYDILDEGLIYSDYTSTVGTFDGIKWNIGSLNNGQTEYLNITCIANKLGDIANGAFANSSEVDRNKSNNNDSEMITVYPLADLAVIKIVNNSNPNYLDLIKWFVIVSNNGPNSATGVVVRDIMPEGLELVHSSEYIDKYGNWYVGDLDINDARELDIICRVTSTGVFRNVVFVSGEETDPFPDNNEDDEIINVAPASDLSITKTVSKYYYRVGDAIDYSIKIANNGPDEARNVRVNEILDPLLTLKSFRATKGNYDEQKQMWEIDALDDGESAELHIRAMAAGAGIVNNMVSATSDTFDYNLDNNNATVDVNVSEISKTPDVGAAQHDSLAEIDGYLPEMHVTGNPFVVLLIAVVFSMIFLGGNFSKKR
ncbi:MAG: DUF11 domain-containing protein [Methanobrevibacter sp.]|nr:DUF11 domain-containing protein [Methanobrevibacter sp.]